MKKGYLVCKSAYDSLEELNITKKQLEEQNKKDDTKGDPFSLTGSRPKEEDGNTIKVIKCPLTGDYIEKSKVRKTFFC